MKRRGFLYSGAAAAGAVTIPFSWGCRKEKDTPEPDTQPHFPYFEVSGSHFEVGKQIGTRFANEIVGANMAQKDLHNAIAGIIQSAPDVFYDPFLGAAQNHFPDYVEEIQGIAEGVGTTFDEIFKSNIIMEVMFLYYELSGKKAFTLPPDLGCSTTAYSNNGTSFLTHNEDLFTSFLSYMYLLKVKVTGKPEILCLSYPGILPGVPPGMNEAGIAQCGNDISGLHIEQSVPMAFHFRSVLDATSIDDAVDRAKYPHRARTMTHNIGSFTEDKIVSVEAAPSKNQSQSVKGFYVHTNHFILSDMLDINLDSGGLPSSHSRFKRLTELSTNFANSGGIVTDDVLTEFMSTHKAEETPPCVHNHSGGSTLSHSVFNFREKTWNVYYSNPCLGRSKDYSFI